MEKEKLLNYAKTCRKKTGLSQNEVANLLGFKSPYFISKIEQHYISTALSRALSYQLLFGKQLDRVFPELSKQMAVIMFKRITQLSVDLDLKTPSPETQRKIEFLESVAARIASKYQDI